MSGIPDRFFTPEEYLAFERAAERKHEYFAGRIFAMAGAKLAHIRIVRNLMLALGTRLQESDCEPLCNDMRVKTRSGLYTYPDVVVVCGQPELEDSFKDTMLNPRILIEVLSPSTQDYDRGEKFEHYRTIPSLGEYIVVFQDRPEIVQTVRQPNGNEWLSAWKTDISETLSLTSINCEVPMSEIYRQIDFPQELRILRPHDPHAALP